jgi:GTP-binding protein
VGKSTLFNRLIGERRAIVSEQPGLTRDRIYGTVEWRATAFTAIDTAGLDRVAKEGPEGDLPANTQQQARVALDEANVICLVLDARAGMTAADLEVADILRRARQPVVVVANKSEAREDRLLVHEFLELGMGDPVEISALSGAGTGDLLDRIVAALPPPAESVAEPETTNLLRCAIVGRPNVGKSTLVNQLVGAKVTITAASPNTTRRAVRGVISEGDVQVIFVDTPGLHRPRASSRVGVSPVLLLCERRVNRDGEPGLSASPAGPTCDTGGRHLDAPGFLEGSGEAPPCTASRSTCCGQSRSAASASSSCGSPTCSAPRRPSASPRRSSRTPSTRG